MGGKNSAEDPRDSHFENSAHIQICHSPFCAILPCWHLRDHGVKTHRKSFDDFICWKQGQSISRASSEASRLQGFQATCGFLSSTSCSKIGMVGFGRGGWAHLPTASSQAWTLFINTDAHFDQLHVLHMDGKRSEDSETRPPPPRLPALKEYFRAIPSFSLASFLPGNS